MVLVVVVLVVVLVGVVLVLVVCGNGGDGGGSGCGGGGDGGGGVWVVMVVGFRSSVAATIILVDAFITTIPGFIVSSSSTHPFVVLSPSFPYWP